MNYNMDELLQSCEKEKLHLSAMIQSFASLIALDINSLKVTHCSKNIYEFIKVKPENILGNTIDGIFPKLKEYLILLEDKNLKHPYIYQKVKDKSLSLKISKVEKNYIIDIQKNTKNLNTKNLSKRNHELFISSDSENIYEEYMDIISNTLGFHRVMLYKFQEDWSGKVICERTSSKEHGSYLNLIFPASDIPKIARDLYMINPSRTIANTKSKNVDILTLDSSIPDLTYSDIRSVSPVHIEYLNNMGVISSFSIPIIVSNKLWGLLASHNFEEKILTPYEISMAVEQSKLFSLGLQNYLAKERINYLDLIKHQINDIIHSIDYKEDIFEQIYEKQSLFLDFIKSDGFVLVQKNNIVSFGNIPNNESFLLLEKIFLKSNDSSINSSSIINDFFKDSFYIGPSGVLGVKQKINNEYLRCYWFRSEFIEELHWAGNPNKPIVEDANAIRLSPRRSFEKFIEVKRGFSKNFKQLEITSAIKFANIFFKHINKGNYGK